MLSAEVHILEFVLRCPICRERLFIDGEEAVGNEADFPGTRASYGIAHCRGCKDGFSIPFRRLDGIFTNGAIAGPKSRFR